MAKLPDAANCLSGGPTDSMVALYEPLDVIGTGSFGIIRKVLARKELNYARMDERDLKQLNEEVNVLQTLHANDHIIRYHERYIDKHNFLLYIIMEYAENGDLSHVIQRCRRDNTLLPEEVIWCYLTQIAGALYDCHSPYNRQGVRKAIILHRDIKPENIFLDKDNMIKLGDFGLSKSMTATFTTTYVGTPYYMSPELINGKEYDVKSDIWALGCLIYELCAWHPPFHEARNQPELTELVRKGNIPPLPSGYSKDLDTVVRTMLRQSAKQRPTTKQIKTLDQVKIQMRVLELHRINETLRSKRRGLDTREAEVSERERKCAVRERQVEVEKNELLQGRQKLVSMRSQLTAEYERMKTQAQNLGATPPEPLKDVADDVENVPLVSNPDTGSKRNSNQLSRRPLEERRSIPNLTKRLSNCSLMSVDGETPNKVPNTNKDANGTVTPTSAHARRVASARSLANMMAAAKADAQTPPVPTDISVGATKFDDPAHSSSETSTSASASGSGSSTQARSVDSNKSGHTRRSRSDPPPPGQMPSSPSKAVSRPPMPDHLSEAQIAAIAASRPPMEPRMTAPAAPTSIPAESGSQDNSSGSNTPTGQIQQYELGNDDSLPSPFVKPGGKVAHVPQSNAPPSVMAAIGAAAKAARGGLRPAPQAPTGVNGAAAGRGTTGVTTRRQSLATRLAMAKGGRPEEGSQSPTPQDSQQTQQQQSSATQQRPPSRNYQFGSGRARRASGTPLQS